MNTIPRPPLYRAFLWQLAVASLIGVILTLFDRVQGHSFIIGCLIHIGGSLYFARQAFRYSGARQTQAMVRSMYRGEAGKIVLSGALFAMVFAVVRPLSAASVFIGYLVMWGVNLFAMARILK